MSNNGKIKVYKNPARTRPDLPKPYVPQYQVLGKEPLERSNATAPAGYTMVVQKTPPTDDNPRLPRAAIRQPYAKEADSPIGRGKGPIPNVGNNIEQTWSVDSEIIDDISGVDLDHPMIDNNEFVTDRALGINSVKPFVSQAVIEDVLKSESVFEIIKDLEEDLYLLMVKGANVCSGPLDYIQEQTSKLVFGEHELYPGNPIATDDIIVIKRVKLKVGVFLE